MAYEGPPKRVLEPPRLRRSPETGGVYLPWSSMNRHTGTMGNRSPEVDAWFETYDNPQKDLVKAVRSIILNVDDRMSEAIKWKAPTFVYRGNLASFYPKSAKHVSLLFHTGASLPDPTGLLEGEGDTSRVARFLDADDLAAKADALRALVRAWILSRE